MIDGLVADLEISVVDEREIREMAPGLAGEIGIATVQNRIGEEPVVVHRAQLGSVTILWTVGSRRGVGEVQRDAHLLSVVAGFTHLANRHAVAQQNVVSGGEGPVGLGAAGGVDAPGVPEHCHHPRLVVGEPILHPITQSVLHRDRVLHEPFGDVTVHPPTQILQRLGQIPVVQRRHRLDAFGQKIVDEPIVKRETGLVEGPRTQRLDTRPGHGEAVRVDAELAHQRQILGHSVVVITRHVAGIAPHHLALGVAEGVPDRDAPAVLVDGSLDLVSGGSRSEDEVFRQADGAEIGGHVVPLSR